MEHYNPCVRILLEVVQAVDRINIARITDIDDLTNKSYVIQPDEGASGL
jgi:hypothetical protein